MGEVSSAASLRFTGVVFWGRCDRAVKGAALFALKKRPARGALKIQMLSYGEAIRRLWMLYVALELCAFRNFPESTTPAENGRHFLRTPYEIVLFACI